MTEEREHNALQDAVDIVDAYALTTLRVFEPTPAWPCGCHVDRSGDI